VKTTTAGQIDKAVSSYRAMLEKHAKDFQAEAVQTVLGQSGFVEEMFNLFCWWVEMLSNLIVRRVKVNRNRTPQEALDATGRRQYTHQAIVDNAPKGEGDEVEVVFFKPEMWEYTRPGLMNEGGLERVLARRGLKSADLYSIAAVNEDDPSFADKVPHGIHWKDAKGNWCFAAFHRWYAEREVCVNRIDGVWNGSWWFAGLRK